MREIRFFEEYITADAIDGAKGFAIGERYCTTPKQQENAIRAVGEGTIRCWRYMNSIYWYAIGGKQDDTPDF
ncbi:MAG: hypothetical protein QF619_05075 [Candidatus Binatia bacterium]|nr:hypothetical protein [Candidatus Binatia bacterium]